MRNFTHGRTTAFCRAARIRKNWCRTRGRSIPAAIAPTDRDGLYGAVRFSNCARKRGVAAIIGSELTFEDGAHILLLVENERGYANLCQLTPSAQLVEARAMPASGWTTPTS